MTHRTSEASEANAMGELASQPALDEALRDRFSPGFASVFRWYVQRLLRKRFHAVRLLRGSGDVLAGADRFEGPLIIAMTHPSWWDPLVAFWLGSRWFPTRTPLAPMDAAQLRRFGFFRRLGVFGIDPDAPESLPATVRHVVARLQQSPRTVLWITPQGRFTDPREDAPLRPGAAAIAARRAAVRVVAVAFEYAFWRDQRPEIFLAAESVVTEGDGFGRTAAWHRALDATVRRTRERLASAVTARDPAAFEIGMGGAIARINPFYDLWLRLHGSGGAIEARRDSHPTGPSGDHAR